MNNNIDITKLTDVEIKALAYDEIAKLEIATANIKVCNAELLKRSQPAVEPNYDGAIKSPTEFLPDAPGGEQTPV